jgi:hypothetical protein
MLNNNSYVLVEAWVQSFKHVLASRDVGGACSLSDKFQVGWIGNKVYISMFGRFLVLGRKDVGM